ncbi:hypothetical protein GCM10018793_29960 [Streptomyces sulfonofaciens]|uniref:Secreted protein n=1 Tax=Streptomyces sulfonofaciens TaxID=68272 RepID=A0A919G5N9_9ACTN|nr:hypothetical protein GCM10018793_29960 [Streptomyces sulfonofaciens]
MWVRSFTRTPPAVAVAVAVAVAAVADTGGRAGVPGAPPWAELSDGPPGLREAAQLAVRLALAGHTWASEVSNGFHQVVPAGGPVGEEAEQGVAKAQGASPSPHSPHGMQE